MGMHAHQQHIGLDLMAQGLRSIIGLRHAHQLNVRVVSQNGSNAFCNHLVLGR
jgi:hypothetical protein